MKEFFTASGLIVIAMPAFVFLTALFILWAKELESSGTSTYFKKTLLLLGGLASVISGVIFILMVVNIYMRGGMIS